jgi:acetyl esterase/lipase
LHEKHDDGYLPTLKDMEWFCNYYLLDRKDGENPYASPLLGDLRSLPLALTKTAEFDAHGPAAVALLRLVPGARVLISFPAGAYRMNPGTFKIYTLLGCLTWNITLVYLGWWLGSSWGAATSLFTHLSPFIYLATIVFALLILSRRSLTVNEIRSG